MYETGPFEAPVHPYNYTTPKNLEQSLSDFDGTCDSRGLPLYPPSEAVK